MLAHEARSGVAVGRGAGGRVGLALAAGRGVVRRLELVAGAAEAGAAVEHDREVRQRAVEPGELAVERRHLDAADRAPGQQQRGGRLGLDAHLVDQLAVEARLLVDTSCSRPSAAGRSSPAGARRSRAAVPKCWVNLPFTCAARGRAPPRACLESEKLLLLDDVHRHVRVVERRARDELLRLGEPAAPPRGPPLPARPRECRGRAPAPGSPLGLLLGGRAGGRASA